MAYSSDLAWRVVYKRLWLCQSWSCIARDLGKTARQTQNGVRWVQMARNTMRGIVQRYEETGDVRTMMGRRSAPPANLLMTSDRALLLLEMVLDSPSATLQEHHAAFCFQTGQKIHVGTICRAMKQLGITRKQTKRLEICCAGQRFEGCCTTAAAAAETSARAGLRR